MRVVVDVLEAQGLEPPRGPRGQVSSAVPAVDDYRTSLIELADAFGVDMPQRNTDGAGKVVFLELLCRQDLD
jgi:hypothetical protein